MTCFKTWKGLELTLMGVETKSLQICLRPDLTIGTVAEAPRSRVCGHLIFSLFVYAIYILFLNLKLRF